MSSNTILTYKTDEIRQDLYHWIQPPQWTNIFETVQDYRSANSTEWYVRHPIVRAWSESSYQYYDAKQSVLHTYGKPPFQAMDLELIHP